MNIPLVIIAGGKGTRLGLINKPKPLAKVGGKSILERQLEIAKRYSIKNCYVLIGHLGEKIKDEIGNGERWNIKINYIQEEYPLGTAGAVKQLEKILKGDFLVFYGDTILDVDLPRLLEFHNKKKGIATLLVHPNSHPFDSDIIEKDDNDKILQIHSKPHKKELNNLVNAALYVLNSDIFYYIQAGKEQDFGREIFKQILKANKEIYAYRSSEYIKDVGTKKRIEEVELDLAKGIVQGKNYAFKQKAIFLDRDGVINEEVGDLISVEKFRLLPDTIEAIRLINKSEYLCIVVTNQPCIAKGFCSEKDLKKIHNHMEWILGKEGVYIDNIYYCPHHPDKGYRNEIPELKIKCDCRKPQPGMMNLGIKDFNIDPKSSYIIGDRLIDLEAGRRANIKGILVKTGFGGSDNTFQTKIQYTASNLLDAIKHIINDNK